MTVSAIILAYNERLHIQRCVENVRRVAQEVFVVDCHSTDGTQEIARACGATVVEHDWPGNQAEQLNWALEHLPITGDWVLRQDADEYLSEELIQEINGRVSLLEPAVTGVAYTFDVVFQGKRLRFGPRRPEILRLWRRGKACCNLRIMDERMVLLEGVATSFKGRFVDHNLNKIDWWIQKHINYANREMKQVICSMRKGKMKGRLDKGFYYCLPLFWRSSAYFLYRYIICLGFLDGVPGFLWAFLQAWWYRIIVDTLLYEEVKKNNG